jgi:pyridoxal phosphate enzyme (YggS family)
MTTSTIEQRLHEVRAAVREAALSAGRSGDDVTLVAASKAQPAAAVREAWQAGQRDFGENYADEMLDKMAALADCPGIIWHFIGRVQRGNAKAIARADVVHGVGSRHQAEAIAKVRRALGRTPLPILLQVNVAHEASKNGFDVDDVKAAARDIAAIEGVVLSGLMAMPEVPPDQLAEAFGTVRRLRDDIGPAWPILSMGMSGDFAVAIAAGATHVRIGTRVFGPRYTSTQTAGDAG